MSRVKKLKLLSKASKSAYHPSARDAAAYERVTSFVIHQTRMAHEAGFAKGTGLDTKETMVGLLRENEECRSLLEHVASLGIPGAEETQKAIDEWLKRPRARMVPNTAAVVPEQTDSLQAAPPPALSGAESASLPDAAPVGEAPAAPPP